MTPPKGVISISSEKGDPASGTEAEAVPNSKDMNKSAKRFLIWLLVACVAALALCTIYYIGHPEEAGNGIIETMNELDNQ